MRRKDREVTDIGEIDAVLRACRVCRIGMIADGKPYVVPMNFGYEWADNGALQLYFHSAKVGRKISALRSAQSICFEMDCAHEVIGEGDACNYSFAFASIIGTGKVHFLEGEDEKRHGLTRLMEQITGRSEGWSYKPQVLTQTCVFCVTADEFTAKRQKSGG